MELLHGDGSIRYSTPDLVSQYHLSFVAFLHHGFYRTEPITSGVRVALVYEIVRLQEARTIQLTPELGAIGAFFSLWKENPTKPDHLVYDYLCDSGFQDEPDGLWVQTLLYRLGTLGQAYTAILVCHARGIALASDDLAVLARMKLRDVHIISHTLALEDVKDIYEKKVDLRLSSVTTQHHVMSKKNMYHRLENVTPYAVEEWRGPRSSTMEDETRFGDLVSHRFFRLIPVHLNADLLLWVWNSAPSFWKYR